MVNTPTRFVVTVSSTARATFPRAWLVRAMPEERVVGMQTNRARPIW